MFVDILKEGAVTIFRIGKNKRGAQQWPHFHPILRYILPDYRTIIPEDRNFSMRFRLGEKKKQFMFGDRCEETTSCYKPFALGIVCLHAMNIKEQQIHKAVRNSSFSTNDRLQTRLDTSPGG
jgi:hypothetical protein